MFKELERIIIPTEEIDTTVKVNYREFLKDPNAEPGVIITQAKPRDLFTYQNWVDQEKVRNVIGYASEDDPRLNKVTGYLHFHDKFGENVIVIGNGHHRALYAMEQGSRIDLILENPPTTEHAENPFRLSNLAKKYGNIYHGL